MGMGEEKKLIVETQFMTLDLPDEGFKLVHGGVLHEIVIAYETYGELNGSKNNAILICPTLTSDAHAAGYHSEDPKSVGWWDSMIGPDKAVDTNKYHVICTNILGGCKGSTGPAGINPETDKPYGISFPKVTIKDAVRAQKILVEQMGIKELVSVIGGSLGGMQTLEWASAYPDFMKSCVCIAASVNVSPQALAFDIIARQSIEHDPKWRNGEYPPEDLPAEGLSRARQIGHITYLSSASMEYKFGREEREGYADQVESNFSTDFQVESYLRYQGEKFVDRFDPNSYLYITQMMDLFDLEKEHGSIADAFKESNCRFLIVAISSDWLFPPRQQLDIVEALVSERKDVSYVRIDSMYGHDAFLLEYECLNKAVEAFIEGREPDRAPEQIKRHDVEPISRMIQDGPKRILDIGSGDGSFMLALSKNKGVNGVCLDFDFDMVVACMRKGLNALQLDADSALNRFKGMSFDLVLVNQTIQQLHSALQTLKQILRLAPATIISFPNFAYYRCRLNLVLNGKLPVSESLPYEWYNTPNIHVVTLKDFLNLCERHKIEIERMDCLSDRAFGRLLIKLGCANAGAERVVVRLKGSSETGS